MWTNKNHLRTYLLIFPPYIKGGNSTESAGLVPWAANVETSVTMLEDIVHYNYVECQFNGSIGINVKLKRFNVLGGLTFSSVN